MGKGFAERWGDGMTDNNVSPSFATRMKVIAALSALCKTAPYESISVMEICRQSGISRSAFYHHFSGKDDVTRWYANLAYESGIDQIGRSLTWYEGHFVTTQAFEPCKILYANASNLENLSGPRPAFIRRRIQTLSETLATYHHKEVTPLLSFQIYTTAFVEAQASLQWFSGNSPFSSIEEFSRAMESVVPCELHELTKDPVEDIPFDMSLIRLGNFADEA